jgi:predicted dithiol-disulfide oxidoreductase (DUF899 family)
MIKNKTTHPIVSRDEWIAARKKLLKKEKEVTLQRDAVSAKRRELPWVRVEKEYVFDGPDGKQTLTDLFDGRSQLFVKHFMLAPGQETQCVGCSFEVDHIGGVLVHLENHDVSYVAVARAPLAEIAVMKKRMGWRFKWVSSFGSDFNYDFHVSFTPDQIAQGKVYYNYERREIPIEDMSGNSVFYKDETGDIFHTYSTFGRGGEAMLGTYAILDSCPKAGTRPGLITPLAIGSVRTTAIKRAAPSKRPDATTPLTPRTLAALPGTAIREGSSEQPRIFPAPARPNARRHGRLCRARGSPGIVTISRPVFPFARRSCTPRILRLFVLRSKTWLNRYGLQR